MKILTLEMSKLNSILDGLGTWIVHNLQFYKDHSYVMIHQSSVGELLSMPGPDQYKHSLGFLIQLMNMNQYSAMQIIKS